LVSPSNACRTCGSLNQSLVVKDVMYICVNHCHILEGSKCIPSDNIVINIINYILEKNSSWCVKRWDLETTHLSTLITCEDWIKPYDCWMFDQKYVTKPVQLNSQLVSPKDPNTVSYEWSMHSSFNWHHVITPSVKALLFWYFDVTFDLPNCYICLPYQDHCHSDLVMYRSH
jgi:hypothetical protein